MKIEFPNSEKIYLSGKLFPEIKVGMRKVSLTPTVEIENGAKKMRDNGSILIYDTSGPFGDKNADIDLKKGLPRMRENGILKRGNVEQLDDVTSDYGKKRRQDKSLDSLRFEHITLPYRAKKGLQVSQMY